jgi:hypothetical protein
MTINANRNKLALRKRSIRVLTADELRIAYGGVSGKHITRCTGSGSSGVSAQGTTDLPQKTHTVA